MTNHHYHHRSRTGIFALLLASSFALLGCGHEISKNEFAGGAGNGGDLIWHDGKLMSFDLFEAGIFQPFIDVNLMDPRMPKRVTDALSELGSPAMETLVAAKLSEVLHRNRTFGLVLLSALENSSWYLTPQSLVDVRDEDSPLDLSGRTVLQGAIRLERGIYIATALWNRMDPAQQTALIFHELIFSVQAPSPFQSSPRARQVNALLFSLKFDMLTPDKFRKYLSPDYPTRASDVLTSFSSGSSSGKDRNHGHPILIEGPTGSEFVTLEFQSLAWNADHITLGSAQDLEALATEVCLEPGRFKSSSLRLARSPVAGSWRKYLNAESRSVQYWSALASGPEVSRDEILFSLGETANPMSAIWQDVIDGKRLCRDTFVDEVKSAIQAKGFKLD